LIQILPHLTNKELAKYYSKNYYSFNSSYDSEQNERLSRKLLKRTIDLYYKKPINKDIYFYLAKIVNMVLPLDIELNLGIPLAIKGKSRYLDIGCGDGSMLRLVSRYGWHGYGFELGRKAFKNNIFYDSDLTFVNFRGKNLISLDSLMFLNT